MLSTPSIRSEIASLRQSIYWTAAVVAATLLVACTAVVLGGFGMVGYIRLPSVISKQPDSWFVRPVQVDPNTSFFALDPNAPNPSYIPFLTQNGPSVGMSFGVGGDAFDVSNENYNTVLRTGIYEFSMHMTLIAIPPTMPTVGIVMMNSTAPALTEPVLIASFGTLSNITGLPFYVRAATGSTTAHLVAGTSIYMPYLTDAEALVTPGAYWSGALLFETDA